MVFVKVLLWLLSPAENPGLHLQERFEQQNDNLVCLCVPTSASTGLTRFIVTTLKYLLLVVSPKFMQQYKNMSLNQNIGQNIARNVNPRDL